MTKLPMPRAVAAAVAALLLAGTLFAVLSQPAAATPGHLSLDGCLANDASQGCLDLPAAPLTFARSVATSSDGKSVYVVGASGSISHLRRSGPNGQITFDGCHANDASQGCVDLPARPMDSAQAVAVSPDGTSVYVASFVSNSITQFRRAADGRLTYNGCLANNDSQACVDVPFDPLTGATGVTVSPDGRSVYVSASSGRSVAQFVRNSTTGKLSFDGCFANDASQGCVDLPFAPLTGAQSVAVSPDGSSVYVAAATNGVLAQFVRNTTTGKLGFDGCLGADASQGCVDLPFLALSGASSVTVSPDNRSVYVASESTDAVLHFFRSTTTGKLGYDGCLANDASQGCLDLPFAPLDQARGVTVSPDGKSVYVTSVASNSISIFFRNGPDGQISYDRCLANDGSQGCVDLPNAPLTGARGVAVSPDGASVYVASDTANSVAHFFRTDPPGQLSFAFCLADDASQGCVDLPLAPLTGARGLAISSDGTSVYVASAFANSVSHFVRNSSGGQLSFDGCLADNASQGCEDIPASPLNGAESVAVSPDGKSVYVVSSNSNAISQFVREPNGRLSYDGCLANTDLHGCVDIPFEPLHGANGVTVSPDGASVYVVNGSGVSHFFRDTTTGQLTFNGCLANNSSQGCVDLPGTPLTGSIGVTVSPDGKSVYVASTGPTFNGTVTQFLRGSVGQLTFDGCLGDDAALGCVDLPGTPLTGATGVSVSPDGNSVYVASTAAGITHFFRNPVNGRLGLDGCLGNDALHGCLDLPFAPLRGAFGVAVSPDGKSAYTASFLSASIAHFFINGQGGQIGFDNCLSSIPDDNCRDLPFKPLNGARGVVVSPDGSSVYVTSKEANSISHFRR